MYVHTYIGRDGYKYVHTNRQRDIQWTEQCATGQKQLSKRQTEHS